MGKHDYEVAYRSAAIDNRELAKLAHELKAENDLLKAQNDALQRIVFLTIRQFGPIQIMNEDMSGIDGKLYGESFEDRVIYTIVEEDESNG